MHDPNGDIFVTAYDFNRPFADASTLPLFDAIDEEVAKRYGQTARAMEMSNSDYATRFNRLRNSNNMKPPPSHDRKFTGYLVIRKLGTPDQYETWIPDHAFTDIYRAQGKT